MSKPGLRHPLRVDPETGEPMAPPLAEWVQLTEAERERTTFALIDAYNTWERETQPPEGTYLSSAQRDFFDRASQHFQHIGGDVFLATSLMVQGQAGEILCPDVMAVVDASAHDRLSWVVENEGKGPDLAIDFLFQRDVRKHLKRNLARYARLGIREYFVFEAAAGRLSGWHLAQPGDAAYTPIAPRIGFLSSAALGLELAVLGGAVRLFYGGNEVMGITERIALRERMLDEMLARAQVFGETN